MPVGSTSRMLVSHSRPPLFEINAAVIVHITVLLPLTSIISCVLTAMFLHFDESTRTHCRVPNYLPSISAATGGFTPEKYIWRYGIGYHSSLRIFFTILEYQILKSRGATRANRFYSWFIVVNAILYLVENFALVTLTYVSSSDNYSIHEKSFIVFMVTSMFHMLVTCVLYKTTCQQPATHEETISLRRKIAAMLVNYFSFGTAVYVFFRHNTYCEPGVYTIFAFLEYVTVFSNILFHYTIIHDLKDHSFTIGPSTTPINKYH